MAVSWSGPLGLGLGWRRMCPSLLTQSPSRPLSVANSVASYENEGASGPPGPWAGRLGPARAALTPCPSSEAACEDEDDEEDYHNEGYL